MWDKNKYKFEKEFVNDSWKDMQAILDKEMPVKKKKRRGLIILLSILFLAQGFNAIFHWNNREQKAISTNQEKITNNIQKENIETNQEIETKNNIGKEIIETNQHDLSKENIINQGKELINNKITDHVKPKNTNTQNVIKNKHNNKTSNAENRKTKPTDNYSIINNIEINNTSDLIFSSEKKIKSNIEKTEIIIKENIIQQDIIEEENVINQNKENKNKAEFIYLEPIANINFSLDDKSIDKIEKLDFASKEDKENLIIRKNNFGIESGMGFVNKNEWGGKLGFVYTRDINNKLSIHSGLEYHLLKLDLSPEYLTAVENGYAELNESLGTSTELEFLSIENYVNKNPKKILQHKLKIPFSLGYKFHKKWETNIGIGMKINLRTKEIGNLQNGQDALVFVPASFLNDYSAPRIIKPNFDPFGIVGITYYPRNNFGIGLRYDMGMRKRKIVSTEDTSPLSQNMDQLYSPSNNFSGYAKREMNLGLFLRYYF